MNLLLCSARLLQATSCTLGLFGCGLLVAWIWQRHSCWQCGLFCPASCCGIGTTCLSGLTTTVRAALQKLQIVQQTCMCTTRMQHYDDRKHRLFDATSICFVTQLSMCMHAHQFFFVVYMLSVSDKLYSDVLSVHCSQWCGVYGLRYSQKTSWPRKVRQHLMMLLCTCMLISFQNYGDFIWRFWNYCMAIRSHVSELNLWQLMLLSQQLLVFVW